MFTNNEIEEYSDLLQNLNQKSETLPLCYDSLLKGGGKDGIPHFQLLINRSKETYVIWVRGTDFTDVNDIKNKYESKTNTILSVDTTLYI